VYAAWCKSPAGAWPEEHARGRFETAWPLLLPPLVTALLAVAIGLFAGTSYSPLGWARLITAQEYLP
jgi:multicomponent Na+:H+ antiporter subunit D